MIGFVMGAVPQLKRVHANSVGGASSVVHVADRFLEWRIKPGVAVLIKAVLRFRKRIKSGGCKVSYDEDNSTMFPVSHSPCTPDQPGPKHPKTLSPPVFDALLPTTGRTTEGNYLQDLVKFGVARHRVPLAPLPDVSLHVQVPPLQQAPHPMQFW